MSLEKRQRAIPQDEFFQFHGRARSCKGLIRRIAFESLLVRQTPPIALYSAILPPITALAPSRIRTADHRRFYTNARRIGFNDGESDAFHTKRLRNR